MCRRFALMTAGLLVLSSGALRAQTYEQGVQQASIQTRSDRIVYILAGRLWIGDLSNGTGQMVPISGDRAGSPVLSPDGRELVHLEWSDGFRRTLIRHRRTDNAAVTDVIATTRDVGEVIDAHFTRRRLVFAVQGEGLFEVDLAGGEPRQITTGTTDRSPRYSSDGRQVAFVRTVGDAQDLYVLSAEDGGTRRVQSSVAVGEMFDWSPDDRQFVFESFDTGAMELWTVPAAGGAARRITDGAAQDHWPSWAADGFIYMHRERRLQRLDPRSYASTPVAMRSQLAAPAPATLVVRGAQVLDVVTGTWMPPQDITITAGTIAAMEPSRKRAAPPGARVIDASGGYVIPGLVDMHVHYRPWMGPLMDRFGVTVMRDMGSDPGVDWILDERQFGDDGHVGGPRIMAAGPVINGSGTGRIGQVLTERPDILRATINWLADVGMDHIKIGSENTEATLAAVLETARARNLQVWGHIALVPVRRAIAMGQNGIEHLRGIGWAALEDRHLPVPVPRRLTGMRREAAAWWDVSHEELRALAAHIVERKIGWDPTLTVMRTFASTRLPETVRALLPPPVLTRWDRSRDAGPLPGWAAEDSDAFDKAVASQELFLRAYYAAGGPLLTGSDVGPDFVVPGLAVHQEMARFVSMGVAPIDALRAATIHGARAMNLDRAGSLAPGRWGDLLILEGDPLADIASTQRIRTVVRRGRVVHDVSPSARTR
jgi:imidazolonepropionase-like amidohydrolase